MHDWRLPNDLFKFKLNNFKLDNSFRLFIRVVKMDYRP
jgi:hypothetical protein